MRYNVLRRQFRTSPNDKEERKIIDYPTQQYKLTPIVALTYQTAIVAYYVRNMEHTMRLKAVREGNYSMLEITHHLCAGFKALYTTWMLEAIDGLRLSCGGAGFHSFSGFDEFTKN